MLERPNRLETLRELRTVEVFPKLALSLPSLATEEKGDGEPVMVLPGFGAGDASTWVIRSYLHYLGYNVRGWGLGLNRGNVPKLVPAMVDAVTAHAEETGHPLRLVGWSLGGYIAREVARDVPDCVHSVITLGSPVIGGPKYTTAAYYYENRGFDLDAIEADVDERYRVPLDVPVTAIFSKADGVVSWRACIDERSKCVDHVEVSGTHLSLGFSPRVLRIVARELRK